MRRRIVAFVVGCGLTALMLVLAQALAAHTMSDCGIRAVLGLWGLMRSGCADDIVRVGFPLIVIERGGFIGRDSFSPEALLLDLLIALVICIVGGALVAAWWARRAKHDAAIR